MVIEVWLNNKLTVIINFCIFEWFPNPAISKPQNNTRMFNSCHMQVSKMNSLKNCSNPLLCSAFVLCRSYFLPGRNSSALASKPSAINGKCYNSWVVVVVVLSCSPFFASHPQSQFGKAHSTRPTSLVTRVVLTSVVASNATKRSGGKQMSSSRRTWWQLETCRVSHCYFTSLLHLWFNKSTPLLNFTSKALIQALLH